jgi:hypothetical protein
VALGDYDLAPLGYRVEEFVLSGEATSFASDGGQPAHGRWDARAAATASFTTRAVVVRPEDMSRFGGTVMLEWMNVSGGVDVPTEWMYLHRQIVRSGSAFVGVTAQPAGIAGGGLVDGPHLHKVDQERYGELEHPGDAWSYDIFSQVAHLLRDPGSPLLGGQRPGLVLAAGESQSAIYLVTYVNAIDPLAGAVDGVLLHGRSARGAWIDGTLWDPKRLVSEALRRPSLSGHRIREDARVPVLTVQSETDLVLMGGAFARQPDGPRHRAWEVAGAAHFDTYGLKAAYVDDGSLDASELHRLLAPVRDPRGYRTTAPVNGGPQQRYVLAAAFEALRGWASGGPPPPSAEPVQTAWMQPLRLVRDSNGIARGGVRSPWVDAPLASLSGLGQRTTGFGMLFGTTRPLDAQARDRLYPSGRDDYVEQFRLAAADAVRRGHLLASDLPEVLGLGEAAWPR